MGNSRKSRQIDFIEVDLVVTAIVIVVLFILALVSSEAYPGNQYILVGVILFVLVAALFVNMFGRGVSLLLTTIAFTLFGVSLGVCVAQ